MDTRQSDGLAGNDSASQAFFLDRDGSVWLGATGAAATCSPSATPAAAPAAHRRGRRRLGDQPIHGAPAGLEAPHDRGSLRIDFAAGKPDRPAGRRVPDPALAARDEWSRPTSGSRRYRRCSRRLPLRGPRAGRRRAVPPFACCPVVADPVVSPCCSWSPGSGGRSGGAFTLRQRSVLRRRTRSSTPRSTPASAPSRPDARPDLAERDAMSSTSIARSAACSDRDGDRGAPGRSDPSGSTPTTATRSRAVPQSRARARLRVRVLESENQEAPD